MPLSGLGWYDKGRQTKRKGNEQMEIIAIGPENLEREHICCAITEKKGENCAALKKAWMRERFAEGLVFKRLDARGKVFIEYLPAECAWCPIDAPGYMHIDCFWVSGQFKGQGWANRLLEECTADAKAKGKQGLTVLSADKKRPFLSEPGYLRHKGFLLADTAAPFYELLYLPFEKDAPIPRFKDCARRGETAEQGLVLFYSNQCPHAEKYALVARETARAKGLELTLRRFERTEEAQKAPCPFTSYSLFWNGAFVTNEILSEKKCAALFDELKG